MFKVFFLFLFSFISSVMAMVLLHVIWIHLINDSITFCVENWIPLKLVLGKAWYMFHYISQKRLNRTESSSFNSLFLTWLPFTRFFILSYIALYSLIFCELWQFKYFACFIKFFITVTTVYCYIYMQKKKEWIWQAA